MAFDEVQFPTNISRGARGGPRRKTQIAALASGDEERNASWLNSRRQYDIAYGVRNADALATVVAFFEARNGMLYGFRFKDWSDYKSCAPSGTPNGNDQTLGSGNGVQATFQLSKAYTSGGRTYQRAITKPVAGSVLVNLVTPQGAELLSNWDNPRGAGWSNTGATGANNAATFGAFVNAYDIGVTGAGLRQQRTAASVTAGTTYRVSAWIKQGTSSQARLNIRCQPGNLDSDIRGTYAAPAIVGTAGGAVSNVTSTDLGGGVWLWTFDVVIGAGFTTALIGVGNVTSGQTVTILGASIRTPEAFSAASGVTINTATGIVTFSSPPLAGAVVKAGFEFDVPVRFDTDMLDVALDFERLGSITSIPLIEVRK